MQAVLAKVAEGNFQTHRENQPSGSQCHKIQAHFALYAMIPTCGKPAASKAARMAPTRPSIMSLGLTKSAPASAWETACLG